MIIKIKSDVTGKEYSGEFEKMNELTAQCKADDDKFREEEKAKAAKQSEVSKQKKALSNVVETAREQVDVAYQELDTTLAEADKIVKEARERANAMLTEAYKKVSVAEKAQTDAIVAYNKQFGTYQKNYEGEDAQKEFDRITRNFNSWVNYLFGSTFGGRKNG